MLSSHSIQQILGSCSPTNMSTIRKPPKTVLTTVLGCLEVALPITTTLQPQQISAAIASADFREQTLPMFLHWPNIADQVEDFTYAFDLGRSGSSFSPISIPTQPHQQFHLGPMPNLLGLRPGATVFQGLRSTALRSNGSAIGNQTEFQSLKPCRHAPLRSQCHDH